MHPSGPFFKLDEKEYKQALETFPELANYDDDVNYMEKTATGSIDVGYNSYFDNSTILSQFERLFKLLRFKNDFKNHTIEVVVDNATTHTLKTSSCKSVYIQISRSSSNHPTTMLIVKQYNLRTTRNIFNVINHPLLIATASQRIPTLSINDNLESNPIQKKPECTYHKLKSSTTLLSCN
ncbi:unnamed protein product [Adineta ricciae]|uniref:Uncharacterized protein n=1 Tax=Adineta ricciae TaxID=249248 RepID=A0A816BXE0_ADIRI|nr:unnamed protein product [Adineta ricciae]CAF1615288.1 unnamed protein product [Adineta ricciae]